MQVQILSDRCKTATVESYNALSALASAQLPRVCHLRLRSARLDERHVLLSGGAGVAADERCKLGCCGVVGLGAALCVCRSEQIAAGSVAMQTLSFPRF